MMLIEIDFSSEEAIYQQLCNQIIQGIAMSRLSDGEVLPSVRQLAEDVGINMHTVNKAYTVLKQEGFVKVDRRRGAVVCVSADKVRAMQTVHKNLGPLLAQAYCRNLSREEVCSMVNEYYDTFDAYECMDQEGLE